MNEEKIEKIKSLLCKSDKIGTVKDRFFSTSQEDMKTGGVSIYDSMSDLGEIEVYQRADFQSGSRVLKKVF